MSEKIDPLYLEIMSAYEDNVNTLNEMHENSQAVLGDPRNITEGVDFGAAIMEFIEKGEIRPVNALIDEIQELKNPGYKAWNVEMKRREQEQNESSDEYINKYYRDKEIKRKKRKKVGAVGAIRFGKLLPGESKNIKTGWGDNSDTFLPQRVMVRKYPKKYKRRNIIKLKDLIFKK